MVTKLYLGKNLPRIEMVCFFSTLYLATGMRRVILLSDSLLHSWD